MATYNYAEKFERELQQKYARELTSNSLFNSNPNVKFINAQTIKLPKITVSGYRDHNRNTLGFNSGTVANEWEPKKLEHDRDIELFIDPMDVDETNLVLEMANLTNTFENEQVIPETDSYVYSKLYAEATKYKDSGAKVDTTVLDKTNILDWFDDRMGEMDDLGVPEEGRELRLTSDMYKLLKKADAIQRTLDVSKANNIDRRVHSIEDVKIIKYQAQDLKQRIILQMVV